MSFIENKTDSTVYAPGWFLADNEKCTRLTYTASAQDEAVETAANGGKYIPMGSLFVVGGYAVGIVYEDVDVTNGDMPCSVVTKGVVYEDRLSDAAKSAKSDLAALGFVFVDVPSVTRPDDGAEGATGETGAEGATGSTGGED